MKFTPEEGVVHKAVAEILSLNHKNYHNRIYGFFNNYEKSQLLEKVIHTKEIYWKNHYKISRTVSLPKINLIADLAKFLLTRTYENTEAQFNVV